MSLRVIPIALVLAGCADQIQAPPGAVLGQYGGNILALEGQARAVQVQFVCDIVRFPGALVPSATGEFELPRAETGRGYTRSVVSGVGRVVADTIRVQFTFESSNGQLYSSSHKVVRNQRADFSGYACLAGGKA